MPCSLHTGAGADGWHVDGAFKESGPDIVSLYHMLQATPGGGTMFAPLRELVSRYVACGPCMCWLTYALSCGDDKDR